MGLYIFMQKKFFDKAFIVYKSILDIDSKNIPAFQNMAKIHVIEKRVDEAERLLLKTIELDNKSLAVRMFLIGFYINQRDIEKVEFQLQQAIKSTPENYEAHISRKCLCKMRQLVPNSHHIYNLVPFHKF